MAWLPEVITGTQAAGAIPGRLAGAEDLVAGQDTAIGAQRAVAGAMRQAAGARGEAADAEYRASAGQARAVGAAGDATVQLSEKLLVLEQHQKVARRKTWLDRAKTDDGLAIQKYSQELQFGSLDPDGNPVPPPDPGATVEMWGKRLDEVRARRQKELEHDPDLFAAWKQDFDKLAGQEELNLRSRNVERNRVKMRGDLDQLTQDKLRQAAQADPLTRPGVVEEFNGAVSNARALGIIDEPDEVKRKGEFGSGLALADSHARARHDPEKELGRLLTDPPKELGPLQLEGQIDRVLSLHRAEIARKQAELDRKRHEEDRAEKLMFRATIREATRLSLAGELTPTWLANNVDKIDPEAGFAQALRFDAKADELRKENEKKAGDEAERKAAELKVQGKLFGNQGAIFELRPNLAPKPYEYFLDVAVNGDHTQNDVGTELAYIEQARKVRNAGDAFDLQKKVDAARFNRVINAEAWSRVVNVIDSRVNKAQMPSWYGHEESHITTAMGGDAAAGSAEGTALKARQANAVNDFYTWTLNNPNASPQEANKEASETVRRYSILPSGLQLTQEAPRNLKGSLASPDLEATRAAIAAERKRMGEEAYKEEIRKFNALKESMRKPTQQTAPQNAGGR